MKFLKRPLAILFFIEAILSAYSQPASPEDANLHKPLGIPLVLSGNFGELRSNHFHSGLDFKTQGKTGYKIYCAADGYVSRVLVSPWGFGRAVYVTHPVLGLTTVYGHLSSFNDAIAERVKQEQYSNESFSVDFTLEEGEIPVKRGEVICYSGNSGSSGGPHLHMDVRDTETGDALDPMPYFKSLITDNSLPDVTSVHLFSENDGKIIGSASRTYATAKTTPFKAWGKVYPGILAFDKMTGTTNIYGIKHLTLTIDGEEVYKRTIDRFSFSDTRAVNTLVDYPTRYNKSKWVMVTKLPCSMPLGAMVKAKDMGIINIDEEREYKCQFILEDEHGNKKTQAFSIVGTKTAIPSPKTPEGILIAHTQPYSCDIISASVDIPANALYDDAYINITSLPSNDYISNIVSIGDPTIPLDKSFSISIPITNDSVMPKSQYCLVRINKKSHTAVSCKYTTGKMTATINRFGKYAITIDSIPPKITPRNAAQWAKNATLRFKISDNLSGVESFRGELDGKWVLMEYDGKNATLTGKINRQFFNDGIEQVFTLTVIDACGNKSTYTHNI